MLAEASHESFLRFLSGGLLLLLLLPLPVCCDLAAWLPGIGVEEEEVGALSDLVSVWLFYSNKSGEDGTPLASSVDWDATTRNSDFRCFLLQYNFTTVPQPRDFFMHFKY